MTLLQKIRDSFKAGPEWSGIGILIGLVLVALAVAYTLMISGYLEGMPNPGRSDLGQLGDFVGGLMNPVLAFVSMIGLIVTLGLAAGQLHQSTNATNSAREQSELATSMAALDLMHQAATERFGHFSTTDRGSDTTQFNDDIKYWGDRRDEIRDEIEAIFVHLRTKAAPNVELPRTILAAHEKREKRWATER